MQEKKSVLRFLNIGQRIRTIRWLLGLSQGDFAVKIGANGYGTILRYEKNKMKPSMDKLSLIAELGYTTEKWILTGEVNTESCERLIKYANEQHLKSPIIGSDLGVPKGLFVLVENHKIQPSKILIRRFCNFYEISELMFADIFIEIDIGIDNLNSFENSSPINPVLFHKTTEIKKMLYEDEAACDIILELLKARKAMNNAISDLKSLDKSIPKGP